MAIQEKFEESGNLYEVDIQNKIALVRFSDGTSKSYYIPACVFTKPENASLLYAKTVFKVSTLVPRLFMSSFGAGRAVFEKADKFFDDSIDSQHSEDFKRNIVRFCR